MESKEELEKYLKTIENYLKGEADEDGDETKYNANFALYKRAVELRLWLSNKFICSGSIKNEASKLLNEYLTELNLDKSQEFSLRVLIQAYAESFGNGNDTKLT